MISIHENEKTHDINFLDRLGPLDEDWFMLLHNLLQFNPYLRWSASECLNLDIFNSIRNNKMEEKPIQKIQLLVDSEGSYDYDFGIATKYNLKDYLNMTFEEVEKVQLLNQKEVQTTKASTNIFTTN